MMHHLDHQQHQYKKKSYKENTESVMECQILQVL